MWAYVRHTKENKSKGGLKYMTFNKTEEELFCVTRHMEELKARKSQLDENSQESLLIEKDIAKCENTIKDIMRRLRL